MAEGDPSDTQVESDGNTPSGVQSTPANPSPTESSAGPKQDTESILARLGVVDERVLFAPTAEIAVVDVSQSAPETYEGAESEAPSDQTVDLTGSATKAASDPGHDHEQEIGETAQELSPEHTTGEASSQAATHDDSIQETSEAEVRSH